MKENPKFPRGKAPAEIVPADAPKPGPDWNKALPEYIPLPTAWPFIIGLGATMLAWGAVTHWVISLVGGLMTLAGIGGWIWRMIDERPK